MSDYYISEIRTADGRGRKMAENLLLAEGIRLDKHLDYICGMFDDDENLLATGSCFGNTLRCLAVDGRHRGEGLMNEIVSHLVRIQAERGNMHLFLYTKCESAEFFAGLGFYEIARIPGQIVFMENRRRGFSAALEQWESESRKYIKENRTAGSGKKLPAAEDSEKEELNQSPEFEKNKKADRGKTAAIVMNANPFTLGHQYLVEKASAENNLVHLFVVSEDAGPIPAPVRKELVRRGTAHLENVILHDCGPYMISSATFPAYFQKDKQAVIQSQASLDAAVFCRIAERLGIRSRYLGEEPASLVTGIYNQILKNQLPANGIECRIIPRKRYPGEDAPAAPAFGSACKGKTAKTETDAAEPESFVISASTVRQALKDGDMDLVQKLVPPSTYAWFTGPEAETVLKAIRETEDVVHY